MSKFVEEVGRAEGEGGGRDAHADGARHVADASAEPSYHGRVLTARGTRAGRLLELHATTPRLVYLRGRLDREVELDVGFLVRDLLLSKAAEATNRRGLGQVVDLGLDGLLHRLERVADVVGLGKCADAPVLGRGGLRLARRPREE